MNICFVLPKYQRRPVGGYKIVYEYANRFVNLGIHVSILYMNSDVLSHYYFLSKLFVRYMASFFTFLEPRWFHLDKRVRKLSNLNSKDVLIAQEADVIIATAISTVNYAFQLSKTAKQIYLIQDFECWHGISEEQVYDTYKNDSNKIVISKWLKKIVDNYSPNESTLIVNPIDIDKYKINKPYDDRKRHSVGVLYHTSDHKDFNTAYKAILELKERYPDLEVNMFGGFRPSFELPNWIKFSYNANQNETISIYNDCRVFLCSSIREGFGLTGFEAMACGCVVVSTDYEGVREYAIDGFNSFLCPVGDSHSLADKCTYVFDNIDKAIVMSENARNSIMQFSWKNAVDSFLTVLNY